MSNTEVPNNTVDDRYVAEGHTAHATMPRWSPLQIIGLIVGIGAGVLGVAAVASTGFDTDHIYTPQHVVGSFPHSPLLGVIEIGFGLLMVIGAAVPGGVRTLLALLARHRARVRPRRTDRRHAEPPQPLARRHSR